MEDRFKIEEIHICPVLKIGNSFKPNLEYPTRYCVIDEEKEIAIDIETKLQYDYVKTISRLYFISQSYEKINGDRRVAIFPLATLICGGKYRVEGNFIIDQLKNGVEFQDGNEVFNNEQYLEYLNQEKGEKVDEPQKVKQKSKIFKNRKK